MARAGPEHGRTSRRRGLTALRSCSNLPLWGFGRGPFDAAKAPIDRGQGSKKAICGPGVEASIVRPAGIDWINLHRIVPARLEEVLRCRASTRPPVSTLDTERLILRLLTVEDACHFVRLFEDDWEAVKQTGRMPYPVTEDAMRDWIALHAAGSSMTFLMIRREDQAPIGGVGFGGTGEVHELGYALGRPYWGQGYATEGVLAMIDHAQSLGLRALEAFTFVENPASARVLDKAGFTDLGVARRHYPTRGGMRRVRHYFKRLRQGTRTL